MFEDDHAVSLAVAMLQFRRSRLKILPPELFGEPAWDLLLELFVANAEGHRMSARQVCDRSCIPPSVMSRWLKHLSQSRVVVGACEGDLDEVLTLSVEMLARMEDIMEHARQLQSGAPCDGVSPDDCPKAGRPETRGDRFVDGRG